MPALAVFAPCHTRDVNLLGVGGNDIELPAIQEKIKLAACRFTSPGFQNDPRLERIDSGNESCLGLGYQLQKLLSFWFRQKDGEQC